MSSASSSGLLKAIQRSTFSHIFMVFTLFNCGIATNIVQCILYYTIRPLNMKLFQHINYYLLYSLHSLIVFILEWWSNCDVKVFTDPETMKKIGTEDSILIVNHTYDIDWMLGWVLAERLSILGGVKCVIKKSIASLPILGWAWRVSDFLFLDRNWEKDRTLMEQQCIDLHDYPTFSWVTLFPEGTRFTAEKHKASMEFASKRGIPLLKRHLIPRTKGFVQLVHSLKGHYPAIYDMTISYKSESAPPKLVSILEGDQLMAECYLRRYDLTDMPDDDNEISEWMHQLFREKDVILDSYLTCGSFSDASGFPALPVHAPPRRLISLVPATVWVFITGYIIYKCTLAALSYGTLGVTLGGVAIAAAYVGLQKLINVTRTEKGSSYGSTTNKDK